MTSATEPVSADRSTEPTARRSAIIGAMSERPLTDAHPVAELLAGVRRRIVPETEPVATDRAQWEELATAVDELVEVVLVQQDLIENLLVRMSRFEGRDVEPKVRRGA